jgi:hypothetical protein
MCGTPFVLEAVEQLVALRKKLEAAPAARLSGQAATP